MSSSDYELAKKLQQELADEEYAKKLQQELNTFNPSPMINPHYKAPRYSNPTIDRVMSMVSDPQANKLCDKYGLSVMNVTWEDSARWKNSSYGPCISDMTLEVEGNKLPIIRHPNFTDLTWDVPIDKIPLVVGNEVGDVLYTVTLKEYLKDFQSFLTNPNGWKNGKRSLFAERDTHAVMSAQACFLPVEKGKDATFNVTLFNYQSSYDNPAVLAIVATSKGTSAQVITNAGGYNGQKLYFNKKGDKCSFIGQRLSDFRQETGKTNTGPMTQQEKQDNVILIIQVPLKQRKIYRSTIPMACCDADMAKEECAPAPAMSFAKKRAEVEDAIVKIGDSEGQFTEIPDIEIERDPSYPVRVTLQFYKATEDGYVDDSVISTISKQLDEAKKKGVHIGSLVVAPNTGRPTEHHDHVTNIVTPPWWHNWWLTYKDAFPQFNENSAKDKVIKAIGGRFSNATQSELSDKIVQILSSDSQVQWGIL